MKSVQRKPIEPTSGKKTAIQRGYSGANSSSKSILNSRRVEGTSLRPVAELGRIASDANPLRMRGRGTVEDEQLVPTGRTDVDIWRCFDSTVVSRACHLGEDDTSSHQVTMGTGGSGEK